MTDRTQRGAPRIGGDSRGQAITITVDDRPIDAFLGENVATALLAAGVRAFRSSPRRHAPRRVFCAMGVCQECAVWVDDRTVTACMTPVRAGMRIATKAPGHDV